MRRLLLLLLLAPPLFARSAERTDPGGRFTLFVAGREAGDETMSLVRKSDTLVLESHLVLRTGDRQQDLTLTVVSDAADLRLLRVQATGVSGDRRKTAVFARTGDRLVGEIREGETARPVSVAAPDDAVLLLDPFAAPYLLLAVRCRRAGSVPGSLPAFYPLAGKIGTIRLTEREEQALTIDGRAELASRLMALPDGGHAANLWIGEDGRLLVCARSAAGLSAVRGQQLRFGKRPGEDPPPPEGVAAIRVRFEGAAGTLAGTFDRPEEGRPPRPAVLVLSGSGPQDRNGNAPGSEIHWNPLASIAGTLGENGMASLRYDERGVGGSAGTFVDAGLTDLVADARAALRYLASRGDVDPERIAVVGHSEGALIAAMLAGEKDLPVRAIALLGPPAEPLDRILLAQARARLDRRDLTARARQRILGDLVAFFEHVRLSRADVVTWDGRPREARWLREHMATDPLAVYARVGVPALVLQGGRDTQVPPEGARRVVAALRSPGGAKLELLPTLDHYLMKGTGEPEDDYADAGRRMDAGALSILGRWLSGSLK